MMVNNSISLIDQQKAWVKAQVETGHYGNNNKLIYELIRERQLREQESENELNRVRALLLEAEKNGFVRKSSEEIYAEIKREMRANGEL